jgi:HlyD family secretion protein
MPSDKEQFGQDLASLKIDRQKRRRDEPAAWTKWWILTGIAALGILALWRWGFGGAAAVELEIVRVALASGSDGSGQVVLNAAGYIVPHHKIEVAAKVVGRVAWIGVDKGDRVNKGQVLVRLEDDEFAARVRQSEGNLAALQAKLSELQAGSRPEEIALAKANLEEAKADLENSRINLERARTLTAEGVLAQQSLDDAQARYDSQRARVNSLDRAFELVRIGPREEQIAALEGQVKQASGGLAYARTMRDATVIRAPVDATILERNVEIGEFVTTSFVGERGAKGYVVSLADLDDLQVELDISQDDFAKLHPEQNAIVTTDAYRDREYKGRIVEMSPEADRQKATVQVKVQILEPDTYLRPEMNANVAFLGEPQKAGAAATRPVITIPAAALRDGNSVFVLLDGHAVQRPVTVRRTTAGGAEIGEGLLGGEDLIVNPPADLQDGDKVTRRQS